ncbi:MAG TPA: Tim44-like domain-containing protein [Tepidisphaeraceae bacterium]|jgi:endogenous inhibitor of DNA gyrase (YacG/DUF329 family)|nr:Tim44-like domain-containing protein [Tepidisphaeraceae bacterium]
MIWGLVIVFVIIVIAMQVRDRKPTSNLSLAGRMRDEGDADAEAAAAIRAADPAFDREAFLNRVRMAFEKIQAAWSAQNLTAVRPFLSDGVHERFSLQFLEQQALGYRNQVDQVRVLEISLAQAEVGGPFDVLAVRIAARARDVDVSLVDGKQLPGEDRDEPFVEIWSFLRRRGATSAVNAKGGLIEGHCPNCGGEVAGINQSANCPYCKALLRSGQYDWVLAEITQESVWWGDRSDDLPGADRVRLRDVDFNVQELEDFASVCFWRKATADRLRSAQPLAKVSSSELMDGYAHRLLPEMAADGSYVYAGECAVGSVQTIGLLSTQTADLALMEIRWSGTRYLAHANVCPVKAGHSATTRSLMVLTRSASAITRAELALSSSHCPNCGAPLSLATASNCEFCHSPLNDPKNGWVLADWWSMDSPEALALIGRL